MKWSDEALDTSMALEIDLACEIFAGNSRLARMISLYNKSSLEEVIMKILSTAWDFIHIRQFQSAIDGKLKLFFISRDKDLLTLFGEFALQSVIRLQNGLMVTTSTNIMSIPYNNVGLRDGATELLNNFKKTRESKLHLLKKEPSLEPLIPVLNNLLAEIQNCV